MAAKVDREIFDRLVELKVRYGLTNVVIAERLGLSTKTVRIYLKQAEVENAADA